MKKVKTPFLSESMSSIFLVINCAECWFEDEYSQIESFDIKLIYWAADWIKKNT